jgi:hypothetical protein
MSHSAVCTLLAGLTWRIPDKDHTPITEARSSITEMLQMISIPGREVQQETHLCINEVVARQGGHTVHVRISSNASLVRIAPATGSLCSYWKNSLVKKCICHLEM